MLGTNSCVLCNLKEQLYISGCSETCNKPKQHSLNNNFALHGGNRVTQKSLKFAIYFVQRLSAALAPNLNMAANFSVGEVVEILARDKEMDVHVQEEAGEEVTLTERITECLKEVGDACIDVDFFVEAGVSMLVPLYDLSRRRVAGLPVEGCEILNTQIQVGNIMRSESRLWLEAINRRLAQKIYISTSFSRIRYKINKLRQIKIKCQPIFIYPFPRAKTPFG